MKKLIILLTVALLAGSMLTGCATKYYYNDDKAISLTAEYMKEKYGKEIKDIDVYQQTHGSDPYIGVKFKLDEPDAEVPDEKTYEVRVYVDGEGKENHYVKCDNYMNTLFQPFMEEGIGKFLEQNGINDYLFVVTDIYQSKARDWDYYTSDFIIPSTANSLDFYFKNYKIGSRCYIKLPDKEIPKTSVKQDYIDYISNKIETLFDDDHMSLTIYISHDTDFKLAKEGNSNGYKSYVSYKKYINYK